MKGSKGNTGNNNAEANGQRKTSIPVPVRAGTPGTEALAGTAILSESPRAGEKRRGSQVGTNGMQSVSGDDTPTSGSFIPLRRNTPQILVKESARQPVPTKNVPGGQSAPTDYIIAGSIASVERSEKFKSETNPQLLGFSAPAKPASPPKNTLTSQQAANKVRTGYLKKIGILPKPTAQKDASPETSPRAPEKEQKASPTKQPTSSHLDTIFNFEDDDLSSTQNLDTPSDSPTLDEKKTNRNSVEEQARSTFSNKLEHLSSAESSPETFPKGERKPAALQARRSSSEDLSRSY